MTPSDTREPVTTLRTSDNASDPAVSWKVKCLNCGAALAGPFCAECGQRALPPHPDVRELVGDAFSEFSGWDGKLANTLRLLLRRPGELTRQWLEGRRALFISPLRLYLTTSVVYFLITATAPTPPARGSDKIDLGMLKIGVSGSKKTEQVSAAASAAIATKKPVTGAARDSAIAGLAGAPKFLQPVFRRAIDEPAAFSTALRAAMPRALFVLVPVFAGILGLFYRHRNYPEHLYFAIHLHAFFFIARAIGNLALYARNLPVSITAQGAIAIWIVAYAYFALRRVYGGSPIATVLKGVGICALYALVAGSVILAMAVIVAS